MLYVAGDSFWSSRRSLLWREIVGLCRLRGCRCGHLPRHQSVAPVDRMPVGDPGQDVLEVGLRVQTVELGGDDKRVEGCGPIRQKDSSSVSVRPKPYSAAAMNRRCFT